MKKLITKFLYFIPLLFLNEFTLSIFFSEEYLSANKIDFNNHVSSSGMYSYQPRKYVDLPVDFSNGAGVPDVVVKVSNRDLKKRYLNIFKSY